METVAYLKNGLTLHPCLHLYPCPVTAAPCSGEWAELSHLLILSSLELFSFSNETHGTQAEARNEPTN